ncbi:MAG: hypothetical protein P9M14_17325 [Candidatus Alcyoniella australis]|nr:hypothetical protein [Candidatus Alcyoniella australis]
MRFRELMSSQSGKINWVNIVLLAILGLLIYGGYTFLPIYFDNLEIKRFIDEQVLQSGVYEASEIEQNIKDKAVEMGVEPQNFAVSVSKANQKISINCEYSRIAKFFGQDVRRDFVIKVYNQPIRIPESIQPHKHGVASDND